MRLTARLAGVAPFPDLGINEQQVSLAGRDDVSSVRRNVDSYDRLSNSRQGGFCVLANAVKEPDLSLVARDCQSAGLGSRSSREVVLGCVLLVLAVDELVARQAGIDSEDPVVRCPDERLLLCRLGVLAVRDEVVD